MATALVGASVPARAGGTITVAGSGSIAPLRTMPLSFSEPGVVRKVFVTAGERVTPGQMLASLDDSIARARLAQSLAAYAAARATFSETAHLTASDQAALKRDAVAMK